MKELETAEQVCQSFSLVDDYGCADPTAVDALKHYAAQFQPQWIKINSETDLPKEDDCWVKVSAPSSIEGGKIEYVQKLSMVHRFSSTSITHYAPIIKPQPPKED